MRERVRFTHRHEQIAGPRFHLPEGDVFGRQQLELVEGGSVRRRPARDHALRHGEHRGQAGDDPDGADGWAIERRHKTESAGCHDQREQHEPDRPFAPADGKIQRHAGRAWAGTEKPESNQRNRLDDGAPADRNPVGAREPRPLAA